MEGLKKYIHFDVIDIFDNTIPYHALLGIDWVMENLAVINLKKRTMTFENCEVRVISLLDPLEGKQYVEPIKEKFVGGWDNIYNVYEGYINPTSDGELKWRSIISTYSNSNEALEN